MEENVIYYYMKEIDVTTLGMGKRYSLWVQGCNKNCKGCIAKNSHDIKSGTPIDVDVLALEIALCNCDGITISGGEPMLQAKALEKLLKKIREIRPMGAIVFTGYDYKDLQKKQDVQGFLAQIDLLIDGEYIEELNDNKGIRGSSNQNLIPLTHMYVDYLQQFNECERQIEYVNHGTFIHEIGVPSRKGETK